MSTFFTSLSWFVLLKYFPIFEVFFFRIRPQTLPEINDSWASQHNIIIMFCNFAVASVLFHLLKTQYLTPFRIQRKPCCRELWTHWRTQSLRDRWKVYSRYRRVRTISRSTTKRAPMRRPVSTHLFMRRRNLRRYDCVLVTSLGNILGQKNSRLNF